MKKIIIPALAILFCAATVQAQNATDFIIDSSGTITDSLIYIGRDAFDEDVRIIRE